MWDVVIVGAGAAGLFCAGIAGQSGLRVLLLDHAQRLGEKIRISGGGRCNFTNREATSAQFLSENPHFCRSALARYTPADFIALVQRHRIAFHEKHKGQLFCDESSEQIIDMLLRECEAGGVARWQPCPVHAVRAAGPGFELDCGGGTVKCAALVIASGGLSIPKIGASDLGYRLARQSGHRVVEPRPALVPLVFDAGTWRTFAELAGVSLRAAIACGEGRFVEDLLFTHRGLSGPAVLQVSSYWRAGAPLLIDLAPGHDLPGELRALKLRSRRQLGNELAACMPQRLADSFTRHCGLDPALRMTEQRDRDLVRLGEAVQHWEIVPSGSEGWRKAEVTAGGVDTRELSSRSMESRRCPGLYFIGEVVDVTGWLGGYNFQWAWSSAAACARALAERSRHGSEGL